MKNFHNFTIDEVGENNRNAASNNIGRRRKAEEVEENEEEGDLADQYDTENDEDRIPSHLSINHHPHPSYLWV